MSIENQNSNENYSLTKRGKIVRNIAITAVSASVAIPVAVGINHAAQGPEINYSGSHDISAEHGTNPTEMVRENVEYDSNEVPTDEIVDYVVDMPENKEVMSDGLDAGDTLVLPEKAEKAD